MIKAFEDDIKLVELCLKDDRKSQEQLYNKYAPKMYAICLSYAKDRDMAMDILQDSFIKVFRYLANYDKNNSLEGWIRKIVVNTAIDFFRKTKKEKTFFDVGDLQISDHKNESVFSKLGLEEILKHLQRLPDGARMVFNLYAIEGFNHREIAEKLEISEGTSKSQFNRARNIMMQWVEKG